MTKLGTVVRIKYTPDIEGRIDSIYNYVNGSTHYGVTWWSETQEKFLHLKLHEGDFEILDDSEAVDSPVPNENYDLGKIVSLITDPDRPYIVTAHYISKSGCVEYELYGSRILASTARIVVEEQLISAYALADEDDIADVPVGSEGGSVHRQTYLIR